MKHNAKLPWLILFTLLIAINLLIYLGIKINTDANAVDVAVQEDIKAGSNSPVYISVETGKSWADSLFLYGVQYNFEIHNDSASDINDWSITIPMPKDAVINETWNINYEEQDGMLYVTGVDYNETVFAHTVQPFGFIVLLPEKVDIEGCSMNYSSVQIYRNNILFWINMVFSMIIGIMLVTFICVSIYVSYLKRQNAKTKELTIQTMNTFSNFVDAKDPYTQGHSSRVAAYSVALAKKLKMPEKEIEALNYIALLHDIGKIAIPDSILNKPSKLTKEEFQIIETHTVKGAEMLKDFSGVDGVIDGVLHHHEKYDGSGYPEQLKGEKIPFIARLICVADSYDAMNSDRCYRKRLDKSTILSELRDNSGTQFDPIIVNAMIDLITENKLPE